MATTPLYGWETATVNVAANATLQTIIEDAHELEAVENAIINALFGPMDDLDEAVFDLFDYESETDDLEDDRLDREFWARGQW